MNSAIARPDQLSRLNQIPARDVCDLAACPPGYRREFVTPRSLMGEPSPLTQPRVHTGVDRVLGFRWTIGLKFALGMALMLAACAGAGATIWMKGWF